MVFKVDLLSSYIAQVRPDALRGVLAMVALTITEALFFLRALIYKSSRLQVPSCRLKNPESGIWNLKLVTCNLEPVTLLPISCHTLTRVTGYELRVTGFRITRNS